MDTQTGRRPSPIAASKMPKTAKCGVGRAVYKGWIWELRAARSHTGKLLTGRCKGRQYVAIQEVPA